VTIDVLPDARASVEGLHVLCGETVAVRPARPQDSGMIGAYIRALSFASRRNRFLGSVNEMSANELYRMTHGDDVARPALIVETVVGGARVMIGEARYALMPDGLSCEFALSVAEAWRHKGLGTLLIGIIEGRAKALGVRYLVGDVFRSNEAMMALARNAGFAVTRPVLDDRLVRITKALSVLDGAQARNEVLSQAWSIAA
jgi:acetyltransferase